MIVFYKVVCGFSCMHNKQKPRLFIESSWPFFLPYVEEKKSLLCQSQCTNLNKTYRASTKKRDKTVIVKKPAEKKGQRKDLHYCHHLGFSVQYFVSIPVMYLCSTLLYFWCICGRQEWRHARNSL